MSTTMKYAIYLCPQIGTGTRQDPFRSKLSMYYNPDIGEGFQSCIFDAKRLDLNLCWAEDTTHTVIRADIGIITLSPLFDSPDLILPWFNSLVSIPDAVKDQLESKGINMAWLTDQHAGKDVLRYFRKLAFIEQRIMGSWYNEDAPGFIAILKANLDLRVNQIPQDMLKRAKNWLAARGIAVGWIVPTTTIREVVHFVLEIILFPSFRLYGVDL